MEPYVTRNLTQVGTSLDGVTRLLTYCSDDKLRPMTESELNGLLLMTWRARQHVDAFNEQFELFEKALDAHMNPDAGNIGSMMESLKARFRRRMRRDQ